MKAATDEIPSKERPTYLVDFIDDVMVECPQCGCAASVTSRDHGRRAPTAQCAHCGFCRRGWPKPATADVTWYAEQRRCGRCNAWLGRAPWRSLRGASRKIELLCECGAATVVDLHGPGLRIADAVDPYYGYRLWLCTKIGDRDLWAYNDHQLRFFKAYLGATIRKRAPKHNGSLASQLPRWMKAAKLREPIIKAIARLEAKLPAPM